MPTIYHTADLYSELERRVQHHGIRATAEALGFSYPFVYDVLHRRRTISAKMARALGFVALPQQYLRAEDYDPRQPDSRQGEPRGEPQAVCGP